jgi:murein DD-endopeptidase MepM/ murein hydrolase activator NlpD
MWSFLTDLLRNPSRTRTVIVVEEDEMGTPRRHRVHPDRLVAGWGGSMLAAVLLAVLVMAFTPVRQLIPGYGTQALEQSARLTAIRVAALRDSLAVQQRYIDRLQALMTGAVDSTARAGARGEQAASMPQARPSSPPAEPAEEPASDGWEDHRQPALSVTGFRATPASGGGDALPALALPVAPPVEDGFPTRGFDARAGHYAVDIAVSEGEYVQSVGAGYVVLADWTQDGGYTVAVQHADGYLSVYKHNKRLLKNVGDRVRARETVAVTGNTGEITTGPHLHFELWHNGLAQDPRPYIAGW